MLRRMIIKEWKEKFSLFLFALAGFLFFGLAFSAYSQNKEAVDILLGTMTLVFVPIFSLLLGATAFSAEFKDDAWAYLFSRPVRKWQIWLAKYVSLLSMLAVVFVVLALMAELLPPLKAARQTFTIPLRLGASISFPALAYLLPVSLFTAAFSMSILSEKPHVVVFLAAAITYALHIGLNYGPQLLALLRYRFWLLSGDSLLNVINPLIPLSFAAASILTLSRADFSQPGRRAWVFAKFAALFLAVFLGAGAIWTYASASIHREPRVYQLVVSDGTVYFSTDRGIFRFDLAGGKRQLLEKASPIWEPILAGGGKVAFMTFLAGGRSRVYQEIRIIDDVEKEPRSLLRTNQENSPLFDALLFSMQISTRGDKLAFIARSFSGKVVNSVWCVNADGTGLKAYHVNLAGGWQSRPLGFVDSGRYLLISSISEGREAWQEGAKLLRLDLPSGGVATLAEHMHGAQLRPGGEPGPKTPLVAYVDIDSPGSPGTLVLLNAVTLEKRDVYTAPSIEGVRWNPSGDKLVFVTEKTKVGVYSLAEDRVLEVKDLPGYDFRWPTASLDWAGEDKLILRKLNMGVSLLTILNGRLREEREIALPFSTFYPARVWGAGHYAFVANTEKSQLWMIDLNTDHWQRVY